jgi:CRISPR system Cascade subunit CasD
MRHLVLRLEAPLVSFGDVMIDAFGPVADFPACSMLAGLLANALGYNREDGARINALQHRLVYGARLDQEGERFTEFQTAQLGAADKGWTTRGRVEARTGGPDSYRSPHLRYRDHRADVRCSIVLRLSGVSGDAATAPTLDDLATALDLPRRPLFLGRKSCLPARPILDGYIEADTVYAALCALPLSARPATRRTWRHTEHVRVSLPASEPCPDGFREHRASEQRDWIAGVHVGEYRSFRGELPVALVATVATPLEDVV